MPGEGVVEWFQSLGPWTGQGEFSLEGMKAYCEYFHQIQDASRSVHIAGTNGKGSTSLMLAALLSNPNQVVGVNTSPHLNDVRERFLIDGEKVPYERFCQGIQTLNRAYRDIGKEITFHEGVTLLAFLLFAETDFAIYEVGLGGRLDASNVLSKPEVTIITSISLDHQAILGSSIEAIAREKAGIAKYGSPLVVGQVNEEAWSTIELHASAISESILRLGRDFTIEKVGAEALYTFKGHSYRVPVPLQGEHQLSNLACALTAAVLIGRNVEEAGTNLHGVHWPGRLEEVVYRDKNWLLDCAHNEQGIRALVKEIEYREMKEGVLLFAMLQRPDWKQIVSLLQPLNFEVLLVRPDNERALSVEDLYSELSSLGIRTQKFDSNYRGALEYASAGNFSHRVVAGSIYMLADIRALLTEPIGTFWKK